MVRKWTFSISLSFGLVASASAADSTLLAVAREHQELIYERGTQMVVSRGPDATVIVHFENVDRKRIWATFTVANHGASRITVSETDVIAGCFGDAGEVEARVIPSAEIMQREKRKQNWQTFGAALAAGANAYTAGQQGNYSARGTYSGDATGYNMNSGTTRYNHGGSFTVTGYDPEVRRRAVQDATTQNTQMLNQLSAEQAARSAALSDGLFQSQTIEPGAGHSGRVQLERPSGFRGRAHAMRVMIPVGSEAHSFTVFSDHSPGYEDRMKFAEAPGVLVRSGSEIVAYEPEQFQQDEFDQPEPAEPVSSPAIETVSYSTPAPTEATPEPQQAPVVPVATAMKTKPSKYPPPIPVDDFQRRRQDSAPTSPTVPPAKEAAMSMPAPKETPTVLLNGMSLVSKRNAEGAVRMHVLLDLEWAIPNSQYGKMIGGMLSMLDQTGKARVSFPWFLTAEQTSQLPTYSEQGTGVDITDFPEAIAWLRNADLSNTSAKFDATQVR